MSWFEKALGLWVVRHRWRILAVTVLAVIAAGAGAPKLTMQNDLRVFFSEENPQLQALETLENTFTKEDTVLFVVAPAGEGVFTRESLVVLERLTEEAWKTPYSSRVDSITNFQHTRVEGDDLIVEDLVRGAAEMPEEEIKRIRAIALAEPLLVNRMLSPSGHVASVVVRARLPGESMGEAHEVAEFARALAENLRKDHPGTDVYLAGTIIADVSFGEAGQRDMETLVPLMFVVLLVVAGLALRSFIGTIGTLLVIFFSMFTGMGLAGWLGIEITAASVGAPTIILTLAVADSVHLLVSIFHQLQQGRSRREAVAESLRINFVPVFLTSITTVIGFLSMNFSDAPPFRDLGNIVAMGVGSAFLYSIFFLPAFMAVVPFKVKPQSEFTKNYGFGSFADFIVRRRRPIFWGMALSIAIVTVGTARLELNDDWMKYFGKEFPIRQASDFIEDNLTGLWDIHYSLNAEGPGGINDPEYLATVEAFAQWYRAQPNVVHVNSITDTLKRLNRDLNGGSTDFYRIPHERELAAQYMLLYEMSLPFGLDLNDRIDVDRSITRFTVLLRGITTAELRAMDERARAWLKENAPEYMYTHGTGLSIIWAHLSERNINSMLFASFGALVLISGILVFSLRSFKLGLLTLIPNLAPAFMAFGIWGLSVGQVGLGLSVIVAMTLGIVVHDTVHFMSKYLRARREHDMTPADSVRYSFATVGTAMWVTTIALVAGFLVLALSGYKMNADTGLLSAVTITLALGLDFLLLPTLLMKVESKDERMEETAVRPVDIGSIRGDGSLMGGAGS